MAERKRKRSFRVVSGGQSEQDESHMELMANIEKWVIHIIGFAAGLWIWVRLVNTTGADPGRALENLINSED